MRGRRPHSDLREPFLAFGGSMTSPLEWQTAAGCGAALCVGRPGGEDHNEDALAVFPRPDGVVLVTVDGVGGAAQGGEAARELLVELHARLSIPAAQPAESDSVRGLVLDSLEAANQRLLRDYRDAAAVVAIAVIEGRRLRTIHVGDCAVVLCGQRGRLKYQTVAHSPVGLALEAGWIEEHEALEHEDRHLISNAVGARDMRIEVGPWIEMSRYDRVVLGSDGLFDNLTLDEIIDTMRAGNVSACLRAAVTLGRARMESPQPGLPSKPDDLTAVLFSPGSRA